MLVDSFKNAKTALPVRHDASTAEASKVRHEQKTAHREVNLFAS